MKPYSNTTSQEIRGLSEKDIPSLLKKYGENQLDEKKKPGFFSLFFSQFCDFMILTLLGAAAISFFASYVQGEADYADPIIILSIVIINAIIGVYQEKKAENSLEALRSMQAPETIVIRDGQRKSIPAAHLVPGDVVCLETGCRIPADGSLLTCQNLSTQESALTGETEDIPKNTNSNSLSNLVYAGTTVTTGRGIFVVSHTGMHTQIGKIAHMLANEEVPETPLTKRLNKTGKILGILVLIICIFVFILGILQKQPAFSMFMTAVSLGVAAIPESLPALVTIMLSLGVERMAKKNAIIRHLPAVETLGSATIICSDKTGTLTENCMTLRRTFTLGDTERLARYGCLCNNQNGSLEQALIRFGTDHGIDWKREQKKSPRCAELPFDSSRKKMTTLHETRDGLLSITKGAPEIILDSSTHYYEGDKILPLSLQQRRMFREKANEFAKEALRVLAIACRFPTQKERSNVAEDHLIFVGLFGFMDPPRQEVYHAVVCCQDAGIRPIMITGDHSITATAIGKELGICRDSSEVMTGAQLDELSDRELAKQLSTHSVFARVTPSHKVRLVKGYQQLGHVVAMTGDGVNDAPALKVADIGCAMGRTGTDVAKEASDMILMDDNFSTIVSAVREGRGIFDNIKKAIHFLLSCNIGEIMTIFTAILFQLPVPLLPVQLLFINLVTDSFPALCLGVEPPEKDIMKRPPKKEKDGIFSLGSVVQILAEGMFIGALSLIAYIIGNSTMCFAVLSFSQLVHSFNMRSEHSLKNIGVFSNRKLFISVLLCIALQISVIALPVLQPIFHTTSLSVTQWIIVVFLSLIPIPLVELEKRGLSYHS